LFVKVGISGRGFVGSTAAGRIANEDHGILGVDIDGLMVDTSAIA
jgi:UDP-N-acetyl-D-mannosaminuronate dehydrogenase